MSAEPSRSTVRITETGGHFTAVDVETGAAGTGESRAMALVALAAVLGGASGVAADDEPDARTRIEVLGKRVRERFDEAGVTEEDVEEAIEWARSE